MQYILFYSKKTMFLNSFLHFVLVKSIKRVQRAFSGKVIYISKQKLFAVIIMGVFNGSF